MSKRLRVDIVRRRRICRNTVFDVFADEVRDHAGNRTKHYLSIEPIAHGVGGISGVAVLPVREQCFGLLHVFRHPLGVSAWEIPRGFIAEREDALVAGRRELVEETGLTVRRRDMRPLGWIAPEPGVIKARVRLFAAQNIQHADPNTRQREIGHGDLRFFTPARALRMAETGQINEPCTLVAIYRYLRGQD